MKLQNEIDKLKKAENFIKRNASLWFNYTIVFGLLLLVRHIEILGFWGGLMLFLIQILLVIGIRLIFNKVIK